MYFYFDKKIIFFDLAGAFTKQPLPILKPLSSKTSSPVKPAQLSPNKSFEALKPSQLSPNKSFEALKPKAKKQDDIFSDARQDESDGDTSVLSDGQTTDNSEGFNV